MNVVSVFAPLDFSEQVLRGLAAIELPQQAGSDLSLELGLSLWMRRSDLSIDGARLAMLGVRAALVESSEFDMATEPRPLCGVDPRLDVLNLGAYLWLLVGRIASRAGCTRGVVAERAIAQLRARDSTWDRASA